MRFDHHGHPVDPFNPDRHGDPDRHGAAGHDADPSRLGDEPTPVPPPRPPANTATGPPDGPLGALRLTTPTDVIAALPYLAGDPPDPGIVVLALRDGRVRAVLRADLDGDGTPPGSRSAPPAVDHVAAERCDTLLIVAFGPPGSVTAHVDGLLAAARERGITVLDALRVTGGRYWSYTCSDPSCCPPEGTVVDVDRSTAPADAVLRGIAPLRPFHTAATDAARVRSLLEPVPGSVGTVVAAAAEEVAARVRERVVRGSDALVDLGLPEVRAAVRAEYRSEGVTDPEGLAALGVYLTQTRVRDEVWARITATSAEAHQRLWSRVTRHVPERLRAAPAALLAVAAWQGDDRALASAALDVALTADPGYSMALLMNRALAWGLPVRRWREAAPRWAEGKEDWGEGG
ncbi:DUF4192 domain-containing protein [Nocardiopsis sp. EMB25]|uniref:DUF4192 domain-containing protein n=1 Tax=Nocardiopsis sp. EMB25 TaxID=2835867 RepID=UPI00228334FC|nr:DUF4192 domain-containing protein [Nocardiopsis sp. EMB25]MCY9785142.1 DUF4192 domain-containing protein [Nocardiopsis sp. EMB25]